MPVLYAECVEFEDFWGHYEERVNVPEVGSSFAVVHYDLFMMLSGSDRVDKSDRGYRDVETADFIFAKSKVSVMGDRLVGYERRQKCGRFVVVSAYGGLETDLFFNDQDMVIDADPRPEITVEMLDYNFRAPFCEAFLHTHPHIG